MTETVLQPLGLEITDTDVRTATDTVRLRELLAEHGVLVFRDQHDVTDDEFAQFLRQFGELTFTVGEQPLDGHPELNVITNVGRTTPPKSVFHVDTSYISDPPSYTALRAVQIPSEGGQTVFSDQVRALDTLPPDVRADIAGRTVLHEVTGVDPGDEQESAAWHPLVRRHPVVGIESLYLSTPQRCTAVSDLADDDAHRLIERLYEHSTAEANCYRHGWRSGDVVIWDNARVLHKADHSGVVGDRVMHRGMVAGAGYGT